MVEIKGGDGFKKEHTYSIELAKNCLNAGLWEILLYSLDHGEKTLYYQGWFTFPLGYYKQLVESNTGLPYWKVWYYLEHWFDPTDTFVDVSKLRQVIDERPVKINSDPNEPIITRGEQINKKKNIISTNINVLQDYLEKPVKFSTFLPPGIYRKDRPWENEYWRIAQVRDGTIRNVISPANPSKILQELEIIFEGKDGSEGHFYIGGFDLATLPHFDIDDYNQGQLNLMGIGTPPLKEKYRDLQKNPPDKSPFFFRVSHERS